MSSGSGIIVGQSGSGFGGAVREGQGLCLHSLLVCFHSYSNHDINNNYTDSQFHSDKFESPINHSHLDSQCIGSPQCITGIIAMLNSWSVSNFLTQSSLPVLGVAAVNSYKCTMWSRT